MALNMRRGNIPIQGIPVPLDTSELKKREPKPQVLKARKYMKITKQEVGLLTDENPFIKKSTTISLLKRVIKKQGLNRSEATKQLLSYGGNFVKYVKKLQHVKTPASPKKEAKTWKKLLLRTRKLESLTLQKPDSVFSFFSVKCLKKLRNLEDLNISLDLCSLINNLGFFSTLTSVKRLCLELNLKDSPFLTLMSQQIPDHFSILWKNILSNRNLCDLDLTFIYGSTIKDFQALHIFLDCFGCSKISNFSLRFEVTKENALAFPFDRLSSLMKRCQFLNFKVKLGSATFDKKPSRKHAREIFFYIEKDVSLDVNSILSECKSLEHLSVEASNSILSFPRSFGQTQHMKSIYIVFPRLASNPNSFLDEVILPLSNLDSLEHLGLFQFPFQDIDQDRLLKFYEMLALKGLKKLGFYIIDAKGRSCAKAINNLLASMKPLLELDSLELLIDTVAEENNIWKLLSLFPQLKSISIFFLNERRNLDYSLLFKDLKRRPDLEKLDLEIFPKSNFDKERILSSLPPWKKIKELCIKTISFENFSRPSISLEEYRAFMKSRLE